MYLSRSQLYEIAWSKPIIALAKEYGFSDVGFAKICRRNNIPLPPRGYWARVSAGFKVPRPPLPHPHRQGPIYIPPRPAITDEEMLRKKALQAQEKLAIEELGIIEVPDQILDLHRVTKNTKLYFEKIIKKVEISKRSKNRQNYYYAHSYEDRGRLICNQENCFNVTVSEQSIERALKFLDVLVKELEKNGFVIKTIKHEKVSTVVGAIKDHEQISFQLTEGYKYQPVTEYPKEMTELERKFHSGKELVITGKLTFSVLARETYLGRSWTDGKRLIETELPAIIHDFTSLVPRQKQRRIDLAIEAERREEQARIYRERQHQQWLEKSVYDEAMREAQLYKTLKELDAYLNHLEIEYLEQYPSFSDHALDWFSTVRKIAKSQCPVNNRLKLLSTLSTG